MRTFCHRIVIGLFLVFAPLAGARGEDAVADIWKRAETGSAKAMTDLGLAYLRGAEGIPKDPVQAVAWFRKAAASGNVQAFIYLGICYRDGLGVRRDLVESHNWYLRAAARNNVDAQRTVGINYLDGGGVRVDPAEAEKWFQAAAAQDDPISCRQLANLAYASYQASPNPAKLAEAAGWYYKAAEMGDPVAQRILGDFYNNGLGVKQNSAEAARWHEKAARSGEEDSMYLLGRFYQEGEGRRQDYAQAKRWLTLALEHGVEKARKFLELIPTGVPMGDDQPVYVSLIRLMQDFGANPQTAAAKYRDLWLEVGQYDQPATWEVYDDSLTVSITGQTIGVRLNLASRRSGGQSGGSGAGSVSAAYRGFCRGLTGNQVLLMDCEPVPNSGFPIRGSVINRRFRDAPSLAANPAGVPPATPAAAAAAQAQAASPAAVQPTPSAQESAAGVAIYAVTTPARSGEFPLAGEWIGEAWLQKDGFHTDFSVSLRPGEGGYAGRVNAFGAVGEVRQAGSENNVGNLTAALPYNGQLVNLVMTGNLEQDEWRGEALIRDLEGLLVSASNFAVRRRGTAAQPPAQSGAVILAPTATPQIIVPQTIIATPSAAAPAQTTTTVSPWVARSDDPLAGSWVGYYSDADGTQYGLRLNKDGNVELLDEQAQFPVLASSVSAGIATVQALWTAGGQLERDVIFSGMLQDEQWDGKILVSEDGAVLFSGDFILRRGR